MHLLSRVIQSVSSYLEEVFMIVRNGAKKTVFKLFTAPGLSKLNSLPRKCLFYFRHHRVWIKNHKIIERDRLKVRIRWACRAGLAIEKKQYYEERVDGCTQRPQNHICRFPFTSVVSSDSWRFAESWSESVKSVA